MLLFTRSRQGRLAQSVEHRSPKPRVIGSSPLASAKRNPVSDGVFSYQNQGQHRPKIGCISVVLLASSARSVPANHTPRATPAGHKKAPRQEWLCIAVRSACRLETIARRAAQFPNIGLALENNRGRKVHLDREEVVCIAWVMRPTAPYTAPFSSTPISSAR